MGDTAGGPVRGPRGVGRALRECREAFGRSLADVAESTRIRESYLKALEEGDYGAFPGEFWARLFLRSYAQYLGLPPEELIAEAFGDAPPPPARPAAPPETAVSRREGGEELTYRPRSRARSGEDRVRRTAARLSELGPRSARRRWTSPLWGVLATLVVAALLAGIVDNFLRMARSPAGRPPAAAATGGHSAPPPAAAGGGGPIKGGGGTGAKPPAGGGAGTSPPGAGASSGTGYTTTAFDRPRARASYRVHGPEVRLHLAFSGSCWVGVEESGAPGYLVNHVYQAGQTLDLTSARPVTLTLGAAWRASGSLNGQAIGPWLGGRVWILALMPQGGG
jgi:transcriptional regulator with XRE-family HTH domain